MLPLDGSCGYLNTQHTIMMGYLVFTTSLNYCSQFLPCSIDIYCI